MPPRARLPGAFCVIQILNNFSAESGFEQRCALWDQLSKFAGFYRTFSLVVNNKRALFGLFGGVLANAHQGIDDVVKSVDIVVVHHNLMLVGRFFSQRQICLFLNLFFCGHNQLV